MTLLTCTHARTIGVRAMDDQHGILTDTMNELRLAMMRGVDRAKINELQNRLIEFMHMHIWSEEQLMEQTGFPGLAGHRIEHDTLIKRIQETAHGELLNEHLGACSLLDSLRDWHAEHIDGFDQEYGPWLNERGIF